MANNHLFLSNLSHHTWVRFSYHLPFISYQFISPGLVPSWPTMTRFSLPSDTASIVKWSVWRKNDTIPSCITVSLSKEPQTRWKTFVDKEVKYPIAMWEILPVRNGQVLFRFFIVFTLLVSWHEDLFTSYKDEGLCAQNLHTVLAYPIERSVVLNLCVWRKQADFMQPLNSHPTRDQGHMQTLTCPFLRSDLWMCQ